MTTRIPGRNTITELDYGLELAPYTDEFIAEVVTLGKQVFEHTDADYVRWRMTHMPDLSTFTARAGSRLVGFKTGYAVSERRYYSWLGGVQPEYRRGGIASELMIRQHAWLTERGYADVETATDQHNAAMTRINIVHGFTICGMRTRPERTQILFSKALG